jgi:adenylosuccinate lyase
MTRSGQTAGSPSPGEGGEQAGPRFEAFEMACPIDSRYYGADPVFFDTLRPYVSEAAYIQYQARVEVALAEVLAEHNVAPRSLPDELRQAAATVTAADVYREEARIGHVVRALVNCLQQRLSPSSRPFVHLFATSNDITDTATALRFKDLTRDVVLPGLIRLEALVIRRARTYADTVQIGRTHGKFAEPITVGYFLANYVARLGNRIETLETARRNLRGKFSGAVGAYNAASLFFPDPPALEARLLNKLGLRPVDTQVSTQIVHAEYLTDLVHAIVSTFGVLANFADDIRHLHRSEIAEVQERYDAERVGSSTMPHKLNPRNFEFVKSMWKEFMPRMMTVYMDQISEHQRDLTNSASSRFLTELVTAFAYSVERLTAALNDLDVNEPMLRRNVRAAVGETLAEPLYILLSSRGHPDGHGCARRLAARARREGRALPELIREDPELAPYLSGLSERQQRVLEDPESYVGLAVDRTAATCDQWELRCDTVRRQLEAEQRDAAQAAGPKRLV